MLPALNEVLNLRLPADMRAALDGQAQAADVNVSVIARNALAVGLMLIREQAPPHHGDQPPRTPPGASMQVAA